MHSVFQPAYVPSICCWVDPVPAAPLDISPALISSDARGGAGDAPTYWRGVSLQRLVVKVGQSSRQDGGPYLRVQRDPSGAAPSAIRPALARLVATAAAGLSAAASLAGPHALGLVEQRVDKFQWCGWYGIHARRRCALSLPRMKVTARPCPSRRNCREPTRMAMTGSWSGSNERAGTFLGSASGATLPARFKNRPWLADPDSRVAGELETLLLRPGLRRQ